MSQFRDNLIIKLKQFLHDQKRLKTSLSSLSVMITFRARKVHSAAPCIVNSAAEGVSGFVHS